VSVQQNQPNWALLFHTARDLIRQVNSEALIIDHWSFGGATAMMLQINHRESHDVIFLQDPQLLPFLDPQRHDFKFDIVPSDYIVDQPKTAEPTFEHVIEGERILLEPVPEIIAKKIVHRGASIKPRDIFDIAAAGDTHAQSKSPHYARTKTRSRRPQRDWSVSIRCS